VVTRLGYFEFQVACSLIRGDDSELTIALVAPLWISPFLLRPTNIPDETIKRENVKLYLRCILITAAPCILPLYPLSSSYEMAGSPLSINDDEATS